MNHQFLKSFGVAAFIAQCVVSIGCSSSSGTTPPGGTGGATGPVGGTTGGQGGAGGATVTHSVYPAFPGSCVDGMSNPDYDGAGACNPNCQSVGCGTACSQDCCATCGIDATGVKYCLCRTPGLAYANCNCAPPADIPAGLLGGPCVPAGDSRAAPPAGADMAIRTMPCKQKNLVCFTSDSISTSERGCICKDDGGGVLTMHCGSVNKWFMNNNIPTNWMP